ncbi:MAG: hypothetical protein Q8L66_01115 [Caulobacter sp.]|nr:hypothetical protein [Caulobacter sp.]
MVSRDKSGASLIERAEHLQRRRTRIIWIQGLLFLLWQGSFFSARPEFGEPLRRVEQLQVGAYIVWALVLLALLATGGGLFRGRAVRELANDEVTRAHRRSAFVWGYWGLILACLGLYVVALLEPLGLMDVVHGLLSVGLVLPMMRFVFLERRSERHG